jgi:tripartite-type tricarboxylate transporter receptor subunit TctC
MIKKTLVGLALAAAATVSAFAAYPEKTVTMVVPFPPGGSTDAIARVLAQKLSEKLGQSFIIDNKAGATGTIGAAFVKRAPADGYTLFVSSLGPFVIAPHLIKGVQYDALKDFDPITVAVQAPNVLVVPAASPYKTVADLLAGLKKTPGKVSFASSGNGSSDHLSAELFWQQSGTEGLHIPYKGGGPAINDLLGAQVDAAFVNINSIIQHIRSGKVRALAISSPGPLAAAARGGDAAGARRARRRSPVLAGRRGAQGRAGRREDQVARGHRRSAERSRGEGEAAGTGIRDRGEHAGAVPALPGHRVRALEATDRNPQDHCRLKTLPWR